MAFVRDRRGPWQEQDYARGIGALIDRAVTTD